MTAVLNIAILVLIGVSALVAVYFIIQAMQARSQSAREIYGVGQVEARQTMQVSLARAVAFVFVGLILLGVYGLSSRPAATMPAPTSPPPATPLPTVTPLPTSPPATATLAKPTPTPLPADETAQPAPTFTAVPTDTPEPSLEPSTATVNSGVGVWLRGSPSTTGEQLEWVLDGTVLTLLPGLQSGDEFEWQQVRTPNGNEGWVATEFIEYNE